jgi:hypothetical protein
MNLAVLVVLLASRAWVVESAASPKNNAGQPKQLLSPLLHFKKPWDPWFKGPGEPSLWDQMAVWKKQFDAKTKRPATPMVQVKSKTEPTLDTVLSWIGQRFNDETVPRVKSESCKKQIKDIIEKELPDFKRYHPRHPFAELNCHPDLLQGKGYSQRQDGSQRVYTPAPQLKLPDPRLNSGYATIAFVVQLSPLDNMAQVERLVSRILHPKHLYHFSIDPIPVADPSQKLLKMLQKKQAEWEPKVKHFSISHGDEAVDVVYGGVSLMAAYLDQWRQVGQTRVVL